MQVSRSVVAVGSRSPAAGRMLQHPRDAHPPSRAPAGTMHCKRQPPCPAAALHGAIIPSRTCSPPACPLHNLHQPFCSPCLPHLRQASVSEMMATERQLLCCSSITLAILNPRLVVGPLDKGKNLRQGQARSGRPAQPAAAAESRVHIDRPLAQALPQSQRGSCSCAAQRCMAFKVHMLEQARAANGQAAGATCTPRQPA
jgi:hypothetical protein